MSDYPEHDRLTAISDRSQAIGDFLDWAASTHGLNLLRWVEQTEMRACTGHWMNTGCTGARCPECHGKGEVEHTFKGYVSGPNVIDLLAEHFEIDQAKIEAEKRAMLASLRGET